MNSRAWLACAWLACASAAHGEEPSTTAPRTPQHIAGAWHVVAAGESVRSLARRYHAFVDDIEEINGLQPGETLAAGRRVFIPKAHAAGPGRSAPRPPAAAAARPAMARPSTRSSATIAATPSSAPTAGTGRELHLLWPLGVGRIAERFGRHGNQIHDGVDIAAPLGTRVRAAAPGKVIYAGAGVRGYGNLLLIRHDGGVVTVYAHNARNLVIEGATVAAGQEIAEVGATGRATGAHLHFELRRGEQPIDPLPVLGTNPGVAGSSSQE